MRPGSDGVACWREAIPGCVILRSGRLRGLLRRAVLIAPARSAGNHVSTVALVSPNAAELAAAIAPALPGDVALRTATTGGELDDDGLAADIAFGAPDQLAPLLDRLPRLRWVQSTWAGITPFLEQPRRDYLLTGAKDIFGAAMSEYVLGWILALERSVIRHATAHHWDDRRDRGLGELRLGIAGVGSIGREVARRCAPFFAEIVGLNSDGRDVPGCARCYASRERLAFADGLDALAMLLPATPATTLLVDAALLAAMRPGAIVVNGGRANALDQAAALGALETGHLSAVVLDVMPREPLPADDPLWTVPGLYITSHTAAPTDTQAIANLFLANLRRYRAGEPLAGLIDFARGY